MLQLNPPIPVLIRRGTDWVRGYAHVLIDYGMEHDLLWVVFADDSRECWTAPNKDIRAQSNITAGRPPKQVLAGTNPDGTGFNLHGGQ